MVNPYISMEDAVCWTWTLWSMRPGASSISIMLHSVDTINQSVTDSCLRVVPFVQTSLISLCVIVIHIHSVIGRALTPSYSI